VPRRRFSRLSEAEQRKLTVQAGNLSALGKHPSWPDYEQAAEQKVHKIERQQLTMLRGGKAIDQRQIDYMTGFIHGMRYMTRVPYDAEETIERILKARGIEMEAEA